jgi:SAM-dependent methyltransferase
MATTSDKAQYDNVATEYVSYDDLPIAKLEAETIRKALGDCTGLKILDLGGGSGTHARQALTAGAESVDVVDVSEGMMQIGKDIETKAGRNQIRWYAADASQPLSEQGITSILPGDYDIVMANWVFDHAHTVGDLKGMWQNIALSLKPGGKFLGVRVIKQGIWAEHVKAGKYGAKYEDIDFIPGGVKCLVVLQTEPTFSFGGTMMEDSYAMINDIPRELGLVDFKAVSEKDSEVIAQNPEFWKEHLEEPLWAVITARKA